MLRTSIAFLCLVFVLSSRAQSADPANGSGAQAFSQFIGIEASLLAQETVSTMDTWLIEAVFSGAGYEVTSLYGTALLPLVIASSSSFHQHPLGGVTPDALNPVLYSGWPDLQWDSYITIGASQTPAPIQTVGLTTEEFEAGNALASDSTFGGSWYVIPGEVPEATSNVDGRVLIAQLTTDGFVSFQANLQYRTPEGASVLVTGLSLEFPNPVEGCQDSAACNFIDGANIPIACTYPAPHEDCNGQCLEDIDNDGICDPAEIDGCTDSGACNYLQEATEENGTCTYDDGIRDCEGNCYNDCDGNGICEEDELFGCSYANANNFNPDATRDDGSCEFNLTVNPETSLACYLDLDGNGGVGAPDLLSFLSVFGTNCAP